MDGQSFPSQNAPGATGWNKPRRVALICLVLAAITFAVFGQTVRHQFVNYDDDFYVYQNPMVVRGLTWRGVVWAFTQGHSANWHPLTWLSHMLDCQICGLNPGGHHLTNVLLHIATVVTLFLVLRQMTGAVWRSAFVAAVFAIHPLRVESVAWVAERKDVLSGLFFMLTLWAYVDYVNRREQRELSAKGKGTTLDPASVQPVFSSKVLVLFFFACGLLSKPMLVTLPLVLLLLDYWPLQRKETAGRLVLEKLPLLALSAAAAVVTLIAQNKAIHTGGSFSWAARLENALTSCVIYLGQMLWPAGLAAPYPFPRNGMPLWEWASATVLLVLLSILAWAQRRGRPSLAVGWLWYLIMLLPVLGFIQVGHQAHADRYTYLPQIGICVAVTWLVADWRVNRAVLGTLMAGVIAALMVAAWIQTTYWQDSKTWWQHTLQATRDNETAHVNLGEAYLTEGNVNDAITQFRQALEVNPDDVEANNNLAAELLTTGEINEAIALCRRAISVRPDFPRAHFNLGSAYVELKRSDDALKELEEAVRLDPHDAEAQNLLGVVLRQKGRVDEALEHYRKVQQLVSDNKSIHVNIAIALLQKGAVAEAIGEFEKALKIDPDDIAVLNNLAWQLATGADAKLRDGPKAVALAQHANDLTLGKNAIVIGTLAAALAETGKFDEAQANARKAIDLAQAAGELELARRLKEQLKLYDANQPFHRQ